MMNDTTYGSIEVKKRPVALVIAPEWTGSTSSGDEVPATLDLDHDEDYRHWSPLSQSYAPADVLLQYLRGGWQIQGRVLVEVSRCTSRRCTELFYFILIRDGERLTMPVLANPVVLRLAQELGLILVRVHTASVNSYSYERGGEGLMVKRALAAAL